MNKKMNDEVFKKTVLTSLLRLLEERLIDLERYRVYNGRLDKEILDTRNDINRYKRLLEELDG